MRKLLLIMLFIVPATFLWAQVRTVTGTITDNNGKPIPSATVKVHGISVKTDENGKFKIPAKQGDVLQVSSIGFEFKKITVDNSSDFEFKLKQEAKEVEGVVISAFGIKRSVKTTPYAAQQISAEKLTQTRETDLTTALAGKVAGAQVLGEAGSKLGATGVVRLRGVAGFSDAYAIYVVDGTVYTNATDINVDDIENISVLKGPNATALYGQRATGGVIIITTKKANKKKAIGIQFNSSTTFDQAAYLPEYQNSYGGGYGSGNAWAENSFKWDASMPAEWKALNGVRRPLYYQDQSWGPKFDGGDYIPWYAWTGGHADAYKPAKWVAQPNNIKDFYRTGVTLNNNVSISKGGDKWGAKFGYTNLYKQGLFPNSDQTKHLFSLTGNYSITDALTVSTNINYSTEKFNGDQFDSYNSNTVSSFSQWFHRDLSMNKENSLSGLKTPAGTIASWNIDDVNGMSLAGTERPAFWYNPYTWVRNLDQVNTRNRLAGDISLDYKINKKFSVTGAYRLNYRTTNTQARIPYILEASRGDGGTIGSDGYTSDEQGQNTPTAIRNKYRNDDTKYVESNYEIIGNYKENIKNFSFDFLAGGNILNIKVDDSSRQTSGGLITKDVYAISNSSLPPILSGLKTYRQVRSIFFKGNIGYKDFLFLDFSGRNDWSSTLPQKNNSYFYPSLGTSFVFTKFLKNRNITFAKLRASVAQIGSDPLSPYATNFSYTTSNIPYKIAAHSDSLTSIPSANIDPNLKSPTNTSYEAGIDMKFFKNRVGFSVTGYYEVRKDEIVSAPVTAATGFTSSLINAGQVTRKGLEVELNFKPIVTRKFDWDINVNWAANRSYVDKVSPTNDRFTILGTSTIENFGTGNNSPLVYGIAGNEWGTMIGRGIKRLNGNPILNLDGSYVTDDNVNFGNVLPLYNGGVLNSFRYKNFTFSASVDFQCGGKYASLADLNGKGEGLLKETVAMNDRGKNIRDAVSDGGGVHVYGVLADGKPYDTYVDAFTYFQTNLSSKFINDFSVFDASYIKLRELSFGYAIPISRTSFFKVIKTANLTFIARNVLMIYSKHKNIDPTELPSLYYESGQFPGTRSYGFSVKLTF